MCLAQMSTLWSVDDFCRLYTVPSCRYDAVIRYNKIANLVSIDLSLLLSQTQQQYTVVKPATVGVPGVYNGLDLMVLLRQTEITA